MTAAVSVSSMKKPANGSRTKRRASGLSLVENASHKVLALKMLRHGHKPETIARRLGRAFFWVDRLARQHDLSRQLELPLPSNGQ